MYCKSQWLHAHIHARTHREARKNPALWELSLSSEARGNCKSLWAHLHGPAACCRCRSKMQLQSSCAETQSLVSCRPGASAENWGCLLGWELQKDHQPRQNLINPAALHTPSQAEALKVLAQHLTPMILLRSTGLSLAHPIITVGGVCILGVYFY